MKAGKAVVSRPFCTTPAASEQFDMWCSRLTAMGLDLGPTDIELVGVIASRQARLSALAAELAGEQDPERRLRVGAAERLAAQDVLRALDSAEKAWGSVAEQPAAPVEVRRTGTDDAHILPFRASGLGPVARRIVAAVARGAVAKASLRKMVAGGQREFLRGLREALDSGAVVRSGLGRKKSPFTYTAR